MLGDQLLQLVECMIDDGTDGGGGEAKFHFVGIELSHFGGLADEAVQAVAFLVDDGEQFVVFFRGVGVRCPATT